MTRLRQESSGGQAGFPEFWDLAKGWRGRYGNPRKPTERAWEKCVKAGAVESDMILGAKGHLAHIEEENIEPQFVCMASVFLNQWRFEQYVEVARDIEEERARALEKSKQDRYELGRLHGLNGMKRLESRAGLSGEVHACYLRGYEETAPLTPRLVAVK